MTTITEIPQKHTLQHFVPGLALTGAVTTIALWAGAIPAIAGAGV